MEKASDKILTWAGQASGSCVMDVCCFAESLELLMNDLLDALEAKIRT
jgi:hypothetical protein